jgi:hypothetical protein
MDFATTNYRYVRVVESTPASNVTGCVSVGVSGKSARLARELVACWPVLIADVSTRRALPRRVARVNKFNRHTDEPALVENLRLEIGEGPRVQNAALLSISPDPRTDMRQIFERNPSIRAFSNTANLFGNDVVHVAHKSLFASADSAQDTFGRTCAFLLKALALPPTAGTDASHLAGVAESLTIRTLREIHQPKVNTQPADRLLFSFFRHVHGHIEVPLAVTQNQIRLSFWKLKQFALSFAADKRKMLQSTFYCPDAYGRDRKLEIKNASVVGNTSMLSEYAQRFFVQLVSVGNLGIKPYE